MTFYFQHSILFADKRLLRNLCQTFVHILPDLFAIESQRMFGIAFAISDETEFFPVGDCVKITNLDSGASFLLPMRPIGMNPSDLIG